MAPLRTSVLVAVLATLAAFTSACQRNAPSTPPSAPASDSNEPRYAAQPTPVVQTIELQLSHSRLGLYVEATLEATAQLSLSEQEEALRAEWSIETVSNFELNGTIEPGQPEQIRSLVEQAKGVAIGDRHGLVNPTTTDDDPLNVARQEAAAAGPVAGVLLMNVLATHLALLRLPNSDLEPNTPVEVAEETDTVIAEADLVMPTTTVHRYTLRGIETVEGARVAEIDVAIASVAQPELPAEDAETPEAAAAKSEDEAEPAAELKSQSTGTLMFDLDHGVPVSLDLTHTETIRVGDQETEQSVLVRCTYARS